MDNQREKKTQPNEQRTIEECEDEENSLSRDGGHELGDGNEGSESRKNWDNHIQTVRDASDNASAR